MSDGGRSVKAGIVVVTGVSVIALWMGMIVSSALWSRLKISQLLSNEFPLNSVQTFIVPRG